VISERITRPRLALPSSFFGGQWLLDAARRGIIVIVMPLLGLAALALLWEAVSEFVAGDLPGPIATWHTFREMVSHPLYDAGPNDKGIGLQLLASLKRVAVGFGVGTLIAIPLGVLIGVNPILRRIMDPVIQILRPVSPLAWFPIGLVIFQSTSDAAVYIICVTSLWPTVINTAFGAGSIPREHKNVARVFQFSRAQYFSKVVLPYSLPHMLTGMRLSMGIAWMVIVAAEMLSGGTGVGFLIWDSWNALNLEQVIAAIIFIGLVGLALDRCFALLLDRFSYLEAA
jgi:nitrate/nitrite transport system permease protein